MNRKQIGIGLVLATYVSAVLAFICLRNLWVVWPIPVLLWLALIATPSIPIVLSLVVLGASLVVVAAQSPRIG